MAAEQTAGPDERRDCCSRPRIRKSDAARPRGATASAAKEPSRRASGCYAARLLPDRTGHASSGLRRGCSVANPIARRGAGKAGGALNGVHHRALCASDDDAGIGGETVSILDAQRTSRGEPEGSNQSGESARGLLADVGHLRGSCPTFLEADCQGCAIAMHISTVLDAEERWREVAALGSPPVKLVRRSGCGPCLRATDGNLHGWGQAHCSHPIRSYRRAVATRRDPGASPARNESPFGDPSPVESL
jgi:hypothetical protein